MHFMWNGNMKEEDALELRNVSTLIINSKIKSKYWFKSEFENYIKESNYETQKLQ